MRAVEGKLYGLVFETPPDLSFTSLQEAAVAIGPAHVYSLTVNPYMFLEARSRIREYAADVKDNPLAPYINLFADERLDKREWMLEANGVRVGSPGC